MHVLRVLALFPAPAPTLVLKHKKAQPHLAVPLSRNPVPTNWSDLVYLAHAEDSQGAYACILTLNIAETAGRADQAHIESRLQGSAVLDDSTPTRATPMDMAVADPYGPAPRIAVVFIFHIV